MLSANKEIKQRWYIYCLSTQPTIILPKEHKLELTTTIDLIRPLCWLKCLAFRSPLIYEHCWVPRSHLVFRGRMKTRSRGGSSIVDQSECLYREWCIVMRIPTPRHSMLCLLEPRWRSWTRYRSDTFNRMSDRFLNSNYINDVVTDCGALLQLWSRVARLSSQSKVRRDSNSANPY